MKMYKPDPVAGLSHFGEMLARKEPFCFVRFSDGEIEILRNRYLQIAQGKTHFRGQVLVNTFPQYDSKKFDPAVDIALRRDLLEAATKRLNNYFKGVPTAHNRALEDRDFLVRLNGGMSEFMTFSDLLMNSNYPKFRDVIVPLFGAFEHLLVIANYRARCSGVLAHAVHVPVGDNFFAVYDQTLPEVMSAVLAAPQGALVLSSASSLSNIVGVKAFEARPDLTFLDIGTSLNDLLGLDAKTRAYHEAYLSKGWKALRRRLSREYRIKW